MVTRRCGHRHRLGHRPAAASRRARRSSCPTLMSDAWARRARTAGRGFRRRAGGCPRRRLRCHRRGSGWRPLRRRRGAIRDDIDVAVHNAGLGGTVPLVEMSDEQWATVLDITLTGTFRCICAALKQLLPQKSGVIVNNASVLGWRAQPGQAHYAAAKAGRHGAHPLRGRRGGAGGRAGQRRVAQPGRAPVPEPGHPRRGPRRAAAPGSCSGAAPRPGRWPTSSCSWPATTRPISPERSSP